MDHNIHLVGRRRDRGGSLALRQAFKKLGEAQVRVLVARWGVGGEAASDEEVAEELCLRVEEVRHLHDALALLGFLWITTATRAPLSRAVGADALGGDVGEAA